MNGVLPPIDWKCASFFDVVPDLIRGSRYDAAIGNPPFIFFVVTRDEAERLGLAERAVDVAGRTAALKSIRFTNGDLRRYEESSRSKLIDLNGLERPAFSAELEEYIQLGEQQGVDRGYKCRIRNRWFDVPSVYVPDAFLFRRIHRAPLLAANRAGATATDTIHRVRLVSGVDVDSLCGAMVNSFTFAWAEVCGRSYGGGVIELEPREAEKLLIPYRYAPGLDLEYIDRKLRAGDLEAALDHGDRVAPSGWVRTGEGRRGSGSISLEPAAAEETEAQARGEGAARSARSRRAATGRHGVSERLTHSRTERSLGRSTTRAGLRSRRR